MEVAVQKPVMVFSDALSQLLIINATTIKRDIKEIFVFMMI
jgi:hypothetical protein